MYTPCNYCCYQGASSLKLRFFGCAGNTTLVYGDTLRNDNCRELGSPSTINTGVHFVNCDCFDRATDITSTSFGDIASCHVFTHEVLDRTATPDAKTSHLDICIVSTTDGENGPVADFSRPLPDIIGLKHVPKNDFGDVVTFFETSCGEKGVDSHGKFAYPLFPGYGKFASTCPYDGKQDAIQ